MKKQTNNIFSLVTPLLLHMVVSELMAVLAGGRMDSASCTALTALVVLPVAMWMYQRDQKKQNMESQTVIKKQEREKTNSQTVTKQQEIQDRTEARDRKVFPGLVCFLAGSILNILWSSILNLLGVTEAFSNETQEALLGSALLIQIFGLGLLVPIVEELIFRGLIYRRMKQYFPVAVSVLLSSALFAVYHGNPIQMIFAFPMAVILAVIYEKGQWFGFPVLFHMGANLTAVVLNLFL
jgi:hypothetical protein